MIKLPAVQETLLLPLLGRARATQGGSRILSDPRAVEIVSRIDQDVSQIERAISLMGYAEWAASSKQFDSLVQANLRAHPRGPVVDLGAGLDTAFTAMTTARSAGFTSTYPRSSRCGDNSCRTRHEAPVSLGRHSTSAGWTRSAVARRASW